MSTISKAECKCIISSFILIFPFLFAQFLSGLFLFFCGILLIVIFWTSFKGYKTMLEILALLGCVVIPISFVSVFGSNYGLFPVSWFNIIIVLLSFLLLNRNLSKSKALFLLSFIFFLVVEVFFNFNAIDSIKQAINLVVFILAFPIGNANINTTKFIACFILSIALKLKNTSTTKKKIKDKRKRALDLERFLFKSKKESNTIIILNHDTGKRP